MKSIYTLKIEQKNIRARITLNDFDLFGRDIEGGIQLGIPVNQFLAERMNTFGIAVLQESEGNRIQIGSCTFRLEVPHRIDLAFATPPALASYDGSKVSNTVRGCFYSDLPDVAISVRSEPEGQGGRYFGRFSVIPEGKRSVRKWEEGAVLDAPESVMEELFGEYEKLHFLIQQRSLAPLLDFCRLRILDYQEAFGFGSWSEALESLRLFGVIQSGQWDLQDLDTDGIRCDLAGGRRVAEIVGADGKPLIRLNDKETGLCFAVRAMFGRISSRWRLVL